MVTTSAESLGTEEKKLTRAEILAKARAAKANKAVATPTSKPEVALDLDAQPKYSFVQLEVWTKGLLAAMANLGVKTPQGVENCVPVANKVLEVFDAKFNEKA